MSDETKPLDLDATEHAVEQGACCHCGTTIEDHSLLSAEHTAAPMYQPWEETTLALVAEARRLRAEVAQWKSAAEAGAVEQDADIALAKADAREEAFAAVESAFVKEWEKATEEAGEEMAKLSISLKYRAMLGIVAKARQGL